MTKVLVIIAGIGGSDTAQQIWKIKTEAELNGAIERLRSGAFYYKTHMEADVSSSYFLSEIGVFENLPPLSEQTKN